VIEFVGVFVGVFVTVGVGVLVGAVQQPRLTTIHLSNIRGAPLKQTVICGVIVLSV
jgi:hypothetical protein